MMIQLYGGPFDGLGQSISAVTDATIGRTLRLPDDLRGCWQIYKSEAHGQPFRYIGTDRMPRKKSPPPPQEPTP